MLPQENRLTDDYDFRRVRRLGRVFHTPLFIFSLAPAKKKDTLRFGLVVSTKVDKRAVVRNRIKRLLREAIRQRWGDFKPGVDIVMVAKKEIVGKKCKEVEEVLAGVLKKLTP